MYTNTKHKYIYYKYGGKYYSVPTHGKIFKIIDFGRAWLKYGGHTFCSDSFAPQGDAHSQYNHEPYFNPKKPRVPPNPSFDLCRLGCSVLDFVFDNDTEVSPKDMDELQELIYSWCLDDQGKNILYKKNGEERYPNFKLYKMIARTVHGHTPEKQLENKYFGQFETDVGKLSGKERKIMETHLMDVDAIPPYWK